MLWLQKLKPIYTTGDEKICIDFCTDLPRTFTATFLQNLDVLKLVS